jgi:hypothetical protein
MSELWPENNGSALLYMVEYLLLRVSSTWVVAEVLYLAFGGLLALVLCALVYI